MKTATQDIQALSTPLAENFTGKLKSLEQRAGYLNRVKTNWRTSKAAGDALTRIELAKIEAEASIAQTGISLAVATIKTAMVANAMPQTGSLTTRLNSNTTAVNQALTNGGLGEIATHMHNRSANKKLFSDLRQEGKIADDEQEVLCSFAEADAVSDIERTRARTEEARKAVDALHACALNGIASSQEVLARNR